MTRQKSIKDIPEKYFLFIRWDIANFPWFNKFIPIQYTTYGVSIPKMILDTNISL